MEGSYACAVGCSQLWWYIVDAEQKDKRQLVNMLAGQWLRWRGAIQCTRWPLLAIYRHRNQPLPSVSVVKGFREQLGSTRVGTFKNRQRQVCATMYPHIPWVQQHFKNDIATSHTWKGNTTYLLLHKTWKYSFFPHGGANYEYPYVAWNECFSGRMGIITLKPSVRLQCCVAIITG